MTIDQNEIKAARNFAENAGPVLSLLKQMAETFADLANSLADFKPFDSATFADRKLEPALEKQKHDILERLALSHPIPYMEVTRLYAGLVCFRLEVGDTAKEIYSDLSESIREAIEAENKQ
jgi:hypothetical protein